MYIPDAQTLGGSAKTTLNLVDFFLQIGLVGKLVLLLLLFFSVASWAVVFFKWKVITGELQASRRFFKSFSKAKSLQEIYLASQKSSDTILGDAFISAYQEAASQVRAQGNQEEKRINLDIIERLVTHRLNDGVESLERRITFLATTAAVTPFIGLFGTVWGIMDAFREIGLQGSADLATVAPGISEALINTAAGLLAAIPAVIAYNFLLHRIRQFTTLGENFLLEVTSLFQRLKF